MSDCVVCGDTLASWRLKFKEAKTEVEMMVEVEVEMESEDDEIVRKTTLREVLSLCVVLGSNNDGPQDQLR